MVHRRTKLCLAFMGLLVFLTSGYFQNSRPGWNVNSQLCLTAALAERATLRIDAYHEHPQLATDDKAFFEGHFYSDKSPVTAFLAVPVFMAYRWGSLSLGWRFSYAKARYLCTWAVIGGCAALLVMLLGLLFVEEDLPPGAAALLAGLWWLGTPLLGYTILFFNYLPACVMALGGWMLARPCWRLGSTSPWRVLGAGVLLGLASWTLNTLALIALVMTAGVMWGAPAKELWRAKIKRLAVWAVGGVLGASGHFIYTYAIFGSLKSPYVYEYSDFFREQMTQGLMGATTPRLLVAWLVTFHPFQGLFVWFPVALFALAGTLLSAVFARGPQRTESLMALGMFLGLLLYVSAYFMWWGGWAYAPRHLIPALPFLALGLGFVCRLARDFKVHWLLVAFIVAGAVLNMAAVALDPQVPPGLPVESLMHPHLVEHWPAPFWELQRYVWLGGQTDANWGRALGLRGVWSLVPLWVAWLAALVCLSLMDRRHLRRSHGPGQARGA